VSIAEQEANWLGQCRNGEVNQLVGRHVAKKMLVIFLFIAIIILRT